MNCENECCVLSQYISAGELLSAVKVLFFRIKMLPLI